MASLYDSDVMDDDVHAAKLMGLQPSGPSDDIFATDNPLATGLSLDAPLVGWDPPDSGLDATATDAPLASTEAQPSCVKEQGSEAVLEAGPEEPPQATATPPAGPSEGVPDRHESASTSEQDAAPAEEHRIPYSMGLQELERLRLVLLRALGSVRECARQQLSERGMDVSPEAQQLLLKRAQLVLYYMRVHEVSEELLKELHLVELVHVLQREPGLEGLRSSCSTLLRHGAWSRRSVLVGMHPDAPQNAVAPWPAPPQQATPAAP